MMSNPQPVQPKPFGIQDQMSASQQQGVPVAFIAGTRKVAAKWFSPIYNLRTAPAPRTIPSKK